MRWRGTHSDLYPPLRDLRHASVDAIILLADGDVARQ